MDIVASRSEDGHTPTATTCYYIGLYESYMGYNGILGGYMAYILGKGGFREENAQYFLGAKVAKLVHLCQAGENEMFRGVF